ncbi:hypothetical protein ACIBQX_45085 [Nonomuraea sp. NPDC049714]|uniref:hypothetical protein n=1 Tax=Nonomuraea sp. NPDC049714 TaxID=3364357 RepID=UPI0037B968E0
MAEDIAQLVTDLSPYVSAAVAAYGVRVLEKATDDSAEAGVAWGRRILQRIFGTREEDAPGPIQDLAERPDDADLQAMLCATIGKALRQDDELIQEIRTFLAVAASQGASRAALTVTASAADQAQQAVQGSGSQINTFHAPGSG